MTNANTFPCRRDRSSFDSLQRVLGERSLDRFAALFFVAVGFFCCPHIITKREECPGGLTWTSFYIRFCLSAFVRRRRFALCFFSLLKHSVNGKLVAQSSHERHCFIGVQWGLSVVLSEVELAGTVLSCELWVVEVCEPIDVGQHSVVSMLVNVDFHDDRLRLREWFVLSIFLCQLDFQLFY